MGGAPRKGGDRVFTRPLASIANSGRSIAASGRLVCTAAASIDAGRGRRHTQAVDPAPSPRRWDDLGSPMPARKPKAAAAPAAPAQTVVPPPELVDGAHRAVVACEGRGRRQRSATRASGWRWARPTSSSAATVTAASVLAAGVEGAESASAWPRGCTKARTGTEAAEQVALAPPKGTVGAGDRQDRCA